jgi:hypothetical protein
MTARQIHPPTRAMRETTDIDQLKRQARELLEAYRAQSPDAIRLHRSSGNAEMTGNQ